jgi:Ca2+/Na+ antiporter
MCATVQRTARYAVGMVVGGKMTQIGVGVNIALFVISEFHIGYYIVKAIMLPMEYGSDHIV